MICFWSVIKMGDFYELFKNPVFVNFYTKKKKQISFAIKILLKIYFAFCLFCLFYYGICVIIVEPWTIYGSGLI